MPQTPLAWLICAAGLALLVGSLIDLWVTTRRERRRRGFEVGRRREYGGRHTSQGGTWKRS